MKLRITAHQNMIVAIIVLWTSLGCDFRQNKDLLTPELANITASVYASITIKPVSRYYVQSPMSGILRSIPVTEGDYVSKGDLIARISPDPSLENQYLNAKLNLEQAKKNYLGADNRLTNVELELSNIRERLSLDSLNYRRQERLWAQNIGRRIDLDQAKQTYENTLSAYALTQKQYAQTKFELQTQYEKSLNELQSAQDQLQDFAIYAEIDGYLYDIFKEEGEFLSPQEQLAEMGNNKDYIIEMNVDEEDITKVEIGDTVAVTLDAYADQVYTAAVSKIYQKKDPLTLTFRVEAQFIDAPTRLMNGLSGEANIIVDKREYALIIPSSYLLPGSKVLTSEGEKKVRTGVKNMDFVEILSGIDSSTVLLNPSAP